MQCDQNSLFSAGTEKLLLLLSLLLSLSLSTYIEKMNAPSSYLGDGKRECWKLEIFNAGWGSRLQTLCHKVTCNILMSWAGNSWNFPFNVGEFAEVCDLIHSWSGWLWLPVGFGPARMFYRQKKRSCSWHHQRQHWDKPTTKHRSAVNQWNVSMALQSSVCLYV